jgi:hypothetical protein
MVSKPLDDEPDGLPRLDDATVRRFLELGLAGPRRPVDDLVERLERHDGESWMQAVLEKGPPGLHGPATDLLVSGMATLEQLVSIKEKSKGLLRRDRETDVRLAGMLSYFLAIAAALVHHGAQISGRSREELTPVLLDLASATPSPWCELLAGAAG